MNINNAYIYTLHRNSSRQYKVPHNVSSNFVFGQFEVFSIIIRFILLPICHNICFAPLLFYLESEYLEQRSFIPLLTKWIFRTKVLCSFTYKSEYIEQRPLLLYLQSAYISLKGPLPKYSLLILRSIVLTSLTASPRAFYPFVLSKNGGHCDEVQNPISNGSDDILIVLRVIKWRMQLKSTYTCRVGEM